MRKHCSFYKTK